MSNYPFLARNQKTEEDRQRDNIDALWNQLSVIGVNNDQGSYFTGYGEDNELQPERPTGILNTNKGPKAIHEGERLDVNPTGQFSVTPASEVGGQQNLQNIEQRTGMPGYQLGTPFTLPPAMTSGQGAIENVIKRTPEATATPTTTDTEPSITEKYSPYTNRGLQRLERYADMESPVDAAIRAGERERFAGEAAATQGALGQELAQYGITGREALTEQARAARQIGAEESQLMAELRKAESAKAYTAAQQLPSEVRATQAQELTEREADRAQGRWREEFETGKEQWEKAYEEDKRRWGEEFKEGKRRWEEEFGFGKEQWRTELDVSKNRWKKEFDRETERYGDTLFSRMADDAQTTSFETWSEKYPDATYDDYLRAREYKDRELENMDIGIATGWETLGQMRRSGQWEEADRFLEAGDFENYAKIVKEMTGRDIDVSEFYDMQYYNRIMRQLGIEDAQIRNDASRLGVNTAQFEAFAFAVNKGADLAAANEISGLDLTHSQFLGIARDYTLAGREKEAVIGKLEDEYGDEQFESIVNRIGSGATLDMVNRELGTNLTVDEYNSIRETTGIGQQEWQRGISAFTTLMQTGDPDNIIQAKEIFTELFPGVSFNVDQLIEDIGAERYAQSMTDLATLSATFSSWDEASRSAIGLNLIQDLGMVDEDIMGRFGDNRLDTIMSQINQGKTVDEINKEFGAELSEDDYARLATANFRAKELFEGLELNALDEEWNAIEESNFFQGLDDDAQQLIKDTLTAGLTGELEFDIVPSYQVTDAEGRLVKSFDSIADANEYLKENPDEGYSIKDARRYVYKNIISGNTVTVNNDGSIYNEGDTSKEAWESFEEDEIPKQIQDAEGYDSEKVHNLWSEWMKTNPEDTSYDAFALVLKYGRPLTPEEQEAEEEKQRQIDEGEIPAVDRNVRGW